MCSQIMVLTMNKLGANKIYAFICSRPISYKLSGSLPQRQSTTSSWHFGCKHPGHNWSWWPWSCSFSCHSTMQSHLQWTSLYWGKKHFFYFYLYHDLNWILTILTDFDHNWNNARKYSVYLYERWYVRWCVWKHCFTWLSYSNSRYKHFPRWWHSCM